MDFHVGRDCVGHGFKRNIDSALFLTLLNFKFLLLSFGGFCLLGSGAIGVCSRITFSGSISSFLLRLFLLGSSCRLGTTGGLDRDLLLLIPYLSHFDTL